jgi:flagellar hook-associated protein 3 FlgL
MIRISSQQIFSGGISRLQELNSSLNNTQQQISTGKRVNKPSDDPVAAARILKLDQELARVETYQRNVNLADNRLKQEESALASSVDIVGPVVAWSLGKVCVGFGDYL